MDSSERVRNDNLFRTTLLATLYAFPALLAIGSLLHEGSQNPDLWWHLSTGAWIAQHHAVPLTDPFSAYGLNRPWVAYSWLFELMIYELYHWFGFVGPVVYLLLVVVAIGLVLDRAIRSRMGGFTEPFALTGFTLFAMAPLYSVRPWLLSVLFFVVEADILFRELQVGAPLVCAEFQRGGREKPLLPEDRVVRQVWILPVLFALWANVHIQFVYGLAVLVFASLMQQFELIRNPEASRTAAASKRDRQKLWLVSAVSILATLANPYSWRIYQVALEFSQVHAMYSLVTEMRAPDFHSFSDYILLLAVSTAAYVLGRARTRSRIFPWILLAGTTVVSLRSVRDEWIALVVAALIIAEVCGKEIAPIVPLPRAYRLAVLPLALLLVFVWAKARGFSNARLEHVASHPLPVKAADFVLQQGYRGPLYNDFDWGGYFIWRLPRLPVSIDGRANVHGDARIARSVATWNCLRGWASDPEFTTANLVIGPAASPLSSALKSDAAYQLVYEDGTAAVFVKRAN